MVSVALNWAILSVLFSVSNSLSPVLAAARVSVVVVSVPCVNINVVEHCLAVSARNYNHRLPTHCTVISQSVSLNPLTPTVAIWVQL